MSKAQQLFISALKTATEIEPGSTPHDVDSAAIAAFNAGQFDKLDYAEWRQEFNVARQNIVGKAGAKTASEKAAAQEAAKKPAGN